MFSVLETGVTLDEMEPHLQKRYIDSNIIDSPTLKLTYSGENNFPMSFIMIKVLLKTLVGVQANKVQLTLLASYTFPLKKNGTDETSKLVISEEEVEEIQNALDRTAYCPVHWLYGLRWNSCFCSRCGAWFGWEPGDVSLVDLGGLCDECGIPTIDCKKDEEQIYCNKCAVLVKPTLASENQETMIL